MPVKDVTDEAISIAPKGDVPGNNPYKDRTFSAQKIWPCDIMAFAIEI